MPAEYNPAGITGTVVPYTWVDSQSQHWVQVEWDNGLINHYPIDDQYLIKQGKTMANHTPEEIDEWAMLQEAFKDGRNQLAAVTAQRDELLATMRKLACLGNGDQYGNSEGNTIAQEAIAKCEEVGK